MRLAFVLPGFHRVERGAEVALLSVAGELARSGEDVTVVGSGPTRPGEPYAYRQVKAVPRERFERFPTFPPLRSDVMWEDMTFSWGLMRQFDPTEFDAVITCSFPFTHLAIGRKKGDAAPLRIFVTQNGDWPARAGNSEYRWFSCDGLICTNPDYAAANAERWTCEVIPNGVSVSSYAGVLPNRAAFGLPADVPMVLMVSACIESKRVEAGIAAVAQLDGVHLVVAGDGPLRDRVDATAAVLLPGRYTRLTTTPAMMPQLYASADAFLHMSLLESFGNVFVEAMASGLTVVGHDTPRLRWVVGDGHCLCDTNQPDQLTAALKDALSRGRTLPDSQVDKYDWANVAEKYRNFIASLIARRGTSGRMRMDH